MNFPDPNQLIEQVISQPTPEAATAFVEAHLQELMSPGCSQALLQMLSAEKQSGGVTRRYRALTRLSEYTSAAMRKSLLQGVGSEIEISFPELIVISPEDAAELIDVEEEEFEFKPDSADEWWAALKPGLVAGASERPADDEPLGDIAISKLLASIDNRLIDLLRRQTSAGSDWRECIRECTQVRSDCDRLLTEAQPTYYHIDTLRVREKKVDAWRLMASAYDHLGDPNQSKRLFEEAAADYTELNKTNQADRCLADIAWVELTHEGNIGSAIQRLNDILVRQPANSLEHAEFLAELAKMYSAGGDDFEAERIAQRVELELGPVPTGAEFADSLMASLMGAMGGPDNAPQTFNDSNKARSLHISIYLLREQIHRKRGETAEAEKYQTMIRNMEGKIEEGSEFNLGFSDRMSSQLDSLLNQYDKYVKGE